MVEAETSLPGPIEDLMNEFIEEWGWTEGPIEDYPIKHLLGLHSARKHFGNVVDLFAAIIQEERVLSDEEIDLVEKSLELADSFLKGAIAVRKIPRDLR